MAESETCRRDREWKKTVAQKHRRALGVKLEREDGPHNDVTGCAWSTKWNDPTRGVEWELDLLAKPIDGRRVSWRARICGTVKDDMSSVMWLASVYGPSCARAVARLRRRFLVMRAAMSEVVG